MRQTGFRNRWPRRGSRADVAMRRKKLKSERSRLPRRKDLDKLKQQAEVDMARTIVALDLTRTRAGQNYTTARRVVTL